MLRSMRDAPAAVRRVAGIPLSIVATACLLAGLTATGMAYLSFFDGTAGRQDSAPLKWPTASSVRQAPGSFSLLVFAHPRCPCSRATFEELSHALSTRQSMSRPVAVTVLFVRPGDSSWNKADTWNQAAMIPFTRVVWDDSGDEARRFSAKTSGIVLLYSPTGELLFQGGITDSRGHAGDNYNLARLVDSMSTGSRSLSGNFVFGCSLEGPSSQRGFN